MSKKETFKTDTVDAKVEEEKKVEEFRYGISPFLTVTMVKENRVYRFEMPIGSHLDECVEACNECLNITKQLREDAKKKEKEEKEKKEKAEKEKSEPINEDIKEKKE